MGTLAGKVKFHIFTDHLLAEFHFGTLGQRWCQQQHD